MDTSTYLNAHIFECCLSFSFSRSRTHTRTQKSCAYPCLYARMRGLFCSLVGLFGGLFWHLRMRRTDRGHQCKHTTTCVHQHPHTSAPRAYLLTRSLARTQQPWSAAVPRRKQARTQALTHLAFGGMTQLDDGRIYGTFKQSS